MVSETRPNPSLKASTRPRHRHGGSCFFWFLAGGLSGALGIAFAWMMDERGDAANAAGNAVAPVAQEQPKPRFDYATILPELEVLVPDDDLSDRPPALPPPPEVVKEPATPDAKTPAAAKPPPGKTAAQPPKPAEQTASGGDGGSYILQVASFKTPADAERLKAKLALLGLSSSVQQVTINGKDTYYRVRTGPYKGKEAVNKAKSQLAGKGHEAMTIKLK